MKTSTPDSPKPVEPKSILLIGPPGGGKTTLAMQFPSPVFLDCDRNLDGAELFLRKAKLPLSYSYIQVSFDANGQPINTDICFDELMKHLTTLKDQETIKTVVIDSFSSVNEFNIRKILKEQRRGEMEARDWIPFKSNFLTLIMSRLRNLGKTTICTVHEEKVTEPDPKNIMNKIIVGYDPTVQGSIGDQLPGFFTDCWRCESRPAPGNKMDYILTTTATSKMRYLKNSVGMAGEIVCHGGELMFDKIKPYLI